MSRQSRRRGFTTLELVVVILFLIVVVAALFLPATRGRPATRRSTCQNYLKQIGLALHNYHDEYGSFPPAYTVDAEGKPLHSWRTLLLPFVEEPQLYQTIDLTKPWDDPANAEAFAATPPIYSCPSTSLPPSQTVYQGIVSEQGFFRPDGGRSAKRILDDQKVAVVEVDEAHAVHWMSPYDSGEAAFLGLTKESALHHKGGVHVLWIDGSVNFVLAETPAHERRAMLTVVEQASEAASEKPAGSP